MTAAGEVLRHVAATLAYRAAKVLRDVPAEFGSTTFGSTTRRPVLIVAHLADLPRAQRAARIRGAFGIAPGQAHRLQGRSVALVDDVMTTGATVAEAARVLLAAGAREVQIWVLARTPAPVDA